MIQDAVEFLEPYYFLIALLNDLRLKITLKKLCPPGTQLVCLGIVFDTKIYKMSIPETKLLICDQLGRIKELCRK